MPYPYPSPVELPDGRTIWDPGNTPPSFADCRPFQCGEYPDNVAARLWCAYWGKSGALSCGAVPRSGPVVVPSQNVMPEPTKMPLPQATTAVMPSMSTTANATQANQQSQLQPTDLLKPMPSIVQSAPVVMDAEAAGLGGGFCQWVNDNPLLAGGLLVGAYFLIAHRK